MVAERSLPPKDATLVFDAECFHVRVVDGIVVLRLHDLPFKGTTFAMDLRFAEPNVGRTLIDDLARRLDETSPPNGDG